MDKTTPHGPFQAHVAMTFALHGDAGASVLLGCPERWFSSLFLPPHTHSY